MIGHCPLGHFPLAVDQNPLDLKHESSSVGARPSSAATADQKPPFLLVGPV